MDLMPMAELRKLTLKALLWSLAFAAVAGVVAVFVANDIVFRVMGTGFLTAGAALLLLPCSLMIDRPKWRSAGLLGTTAIVVEFILCLMLIWEVHGLFSGGWRVSYSMWTTVSVVAGSSIASMVLLRFLNVKEARVAGMVGLALTGVFLVTAMIATWQFSGVWSDEWWATSATIAILGTVTLVALVGVGCDRRHWRWAGVAAAAVATLLLILEFWQSSSWDAKIISIPVAAAVYIAYANIVILVPLTAGQSWLRIGTLVTGAVTAVVSVLIIYDQPWEFVTRLGGAAGILTACSGMALAVLARLNSRVRFESPARELTQITIFCPRCRKKQTIGFEGDACKACGLHIEVRAEEPTCSQCGYLLYKLTSDVCPECGNPIRSGAAQPH